MDEETIAVAGFLNDVLGCTGRVSDNDDLTGRVDDLSAMIGAL